MGWKIVHYLLHWLLNRSWPRIGHHHHLWTSLMTKKIEGDLKSRVKKGTEETDPDPNFGHRQRTDWF